MDRTINCAVEQELGTMGDRELVRVVARGDSQALGLLYDRFADVVERSLTGRLRYDRAAVKDLLQETFLAAHAASKNYRGLASPRTWLCGIASNLAANYLRTECRRRHREERYMRVRPSSTASTPLSEIEMRELEALFRGVVRMLPKKLRRVFTICDIQELGSGEAARMLGVPVGTVYRRLHDARELIKRRTRYLHGGER